uniref:Uncharacterized protein n=1 Tax=Lygus hesperus TaxID=30085 RepID=A0A146LX16_LYGHE
MFCPLPAPVPGIALCVLIAQSVEHGQAKKKKKKKVSTAVVLRLLFVHLRCRQHSSSPKPLCCEIPSAAVVRCLLKIMEHQEHTTGWGRTLVALPIKDFVNDKIALCNFVFYV